MQQESYNNSVDESEQVYLESGQQMQQESDQQISMLDQMNQDDDYNSNEEIEEDITIQKIDSSALPKQIVQFASKYKQIDPFKHFKIPKSKEVPKSVCAKIISYSQTIIECLDCAMDQSCIICLQCFKNGNHEGHKYVAKKAGGGCCDCGDIQAWKKQGFCKNHSGQFLDFQISEKQLQNFYRITDGIFYMYFYKNIKKQSDAAHYADSLIKFIEKLNQKDLYYNKMTALALKRTLPPEYSLNQTLNGRTILENIFTFSISGKLISKWWNNCFMGLFPYYPFKMDVLSFYMNHYSLLMNGDKNAKNCATSITCQLLTSHKLVQQYANNNCEPLGFQAKFPKNTSQLWDFTIILLHDLKLVTKLSDNAPLAYWRMHINFGLENIFEYQQIVLKKAVKDAQDMPETALLSKYIHFCQLQFTFLDTFFFSVLQVIRVQRTLLIKMIKFLYKKCHNPSQHRNLLPTLRIYQRCFALAIFTYFECDLDHINTESIQCFLKQTLPKVSKVDFSSTCFRIIKDIEITYFTYSKCMAETGFAQSLYGFLYFYKNKYPSIAFTDIICLRMMHLFINQPVFLSIYDAINFESFLKLSKDNEEIYNQQLNKKRVYFDSVLTQILYLISSKTPEIYLTYAIKGGKCGLYKEQITEYLLKIFIEKKGIINQEDFKVLKKQLFNSNNEFVEEWIKQNSTVSISKKQINLKADYSKIDKKGLSISSLWVNIQNQKKFEDPQKTIELLGPSTQKVAALLFSQPTIMSINQVFSKLYCLEDCESSSAQAALQKLFLFFYIIRNFDQKIASQLQEKIILPNKNLLSLQLAQIYGFQGLSPKKSDDAQKQKMLALKNKKKQKFKKKQQDFLLKREKQPGFQQIEEGQQKQIACCICKNQNPENLVYLARIQIRNHEKLLKIGPGLECYSFSTCHHLFDYKCIIKNFNKNKTVQSVFCPLCKASANALLPLSIKQQEVVKQFLNRLTQITFTLKQSANLYQEIIKSFYHYIILSSIDLLSCLQKRSKIYSIIFQILKQEIAKKQIEDIEKDFKENKFGKEFDLALQNKGNNSHSQLQTFFQQLLSQNIEQNDDFEYIFPEIKKRKTKTKENKEKKFKSQNQQENPNNWLFFVVVNKIINNLKDSQQELTMEIQEPPYIKYSMQALFSEQQIKPEELSCLQQQSKQYKLLIEMPKKYSQVGLLRTCFECKELSSELILCLLCGWTGCQNCQNGDSYDHVTQKHGQIGALMVVKSSMAYYLVNSKPVTAGFMYQNYWGHSIKLTTDWNQFELNEIIYKNMERLLKIDQVPSKGKK